jgi:hypothetical protein
VVLQCVSFLSGGRQRSTVDKIRFDLAATGASRFRTN